MTCLIFENVTVSYPIFNSYSLSFRNQIVRFSTGGIIRREAGDTPTVTALINSNFELRSGDRVGLIGHNGAGKSTLLRTMAGIYAPSSGIVKSSGSISTVFELGAGIDPELSGYENAIRMGVLKGIAMDQIKEEMPAIEAFSGLGDFIHLPVRTYSAGMSTRLMFAVATLNQPDILLIDEIFGAGDAEFQARAYERMELLIRNAGIFVFASHSKELLLKYCNRFFSLQHGTLAEVNNI